MRRLEAVALVVHSFLFFFFFFLFSFSFPFLIISHLGVAPTLTPIFCHPLVVDIHLFQLTTPLSFAVKYSSPFDLEFSHLIRSSLPHLLRVLKSYQPPQVSNAATTCINVNADIILCWSRC
ncbi:hypothetical protein TorRG33x02_062520 [Trema orientale]|uniref:Uncharacterized protein n=1 Tax=Trema orientale TaxID=63057 RepID=A0A2P5FJH9_TREOI|nr:hypothetical protein TorRG33x02_062520 [Trema orientale]